MKDSSAAVPEPAELLAMLARIADQARASRQRLPQVQGDNTLWDGLAFSIAGVRLVSSMSEIREMTAYPGQITRVPGSKEWMKGLANVRGELLPVIDLQQYFGAKAVIRGKSARMLVIRMRGLVCGLLVPSVQGVKHFDLSGRLQHARMEGALGRYVYEAFSIGDEVWPVFSMSGLSADPEFRSATA